MKNLNTLIQNAIEDYIVSLDKEFTLEDIKEICSFDISNVVWKALREAMQRKKGVTVDPIINGVKQSDAKRYLNKIAENLLGEPIGSVISAIKMLFRDANTYGFNFFYGTNEGLYRSLQHSEDDSTLIVGVGFEKLKNNKNLGDKR